MHDIYLFFHACAWVFRRVVHLRTPQNCGWCCTPRRTNMEPQNKPFEKEHLPSLHFQSFFQDLSLDSHHMMFYLHGLTTSHLALKPPGKTAIPGELRLCLLFFGRTFDSNLFPNLVALHHRQLEQICRMATQKKWEAQRALSNQAKQDEIVNYELYISEIISDIISYYIIIILYHIILYQSHQIISYHIILYVKYVDIWYL